MTWEAIGALTALTGLIISILSGVFALGKQARRIDDLEDRLEECTDAREENNELKVKLAVVETDVKSLIREVSEFKTLLLNKLASS